MEPDATHGLTDAELADLARLVDGTLPADRRAEVEARVATSPQLASIVERQTAVRDAIHDTHDTGAPPRLRARLEPRPAPARRSRVRLGGAVAAAGAVALLLVLALPSVFSTAPSVADA